MSRLHAHPGKGRLRLPPTTAVRTEQLLRGPESAGSVAGPGTDPGLSARVAAGALAGAGEGSQGPGQGTTPLWQRGKLQAQ